ncbi:MAG: YeeE/YedE family protein, partial [Alphaproteobacteria bacterium]|nr:YeeE/YedE family protein [Alphaproteobacteria bacterium]
HAMTGAIAPVGVQVAVGAIMFGIGMQLGGGCGSGTLFTVGGGSVRMVVTLAAFCAGSFLASLHMQWWSGLPRVSGIALGREWGWSVAAFAQLAVFAALWLLIRRFTHTRSSGLTTTPMGLSRFFRGGWPLLWGALALAFLNWLTLVLSGHPWSITWAFTLWGAKTAQLAGWEPAGVWFWSGGFTEFALKNSILIDETTVMNIGIVLGAMTAAGLAGKFRPGFRIPLMSLLAAVLGGLMMGYGARIAYGCNIGAFFSGVASTSVHGWLWIAAALFGTWFGVKIRPLFGFSA